MAANGMGSAALPAAMVQRELAAGAVQQIDYDWVPDPLHFFARFDAERSSQIVAAVADIAVVIAQTYDHKS